MKTNIYEFTNFRHYYNGNRSPYIVMGVDGGYIIEVSEAVTITHRCCSDLGNIEEWDKAANWIESVETMLWIGHPWLLVSSIDQMLTNYDTIALP
jgi:hypothetical protein